MSDKMSIQLDMLTTKYVEIGQIQFFLFKRNKLYRNSMCTLFATLFHVKLPFNRLATFWYMFRTCSKKEMTHGKTLERPALIPSSLLNI